MTFWKAGTQVYLLILVLLDPSQDFQYGSGSRTARSMRIHADPDPQHWVSGICSFHSFKKKEFIKHVPTTVATIKPMRIHADPDPQHCVSGI
jgi:hypothetical protein